MSNIFKPGDKVAILYPYPADNPKPHGGFKHGQPLVVTGLSRHSKDVVYCRSLDDAENTALAVRVERLNFLGVLEKEACKVNEDVPACETSNGTIAYPELDGDYEPFDLVKSKSGSYDTYFKRYKVEEASPTIDGLFVVRVEKSIYYVADKMELWLKPITRKFYANIYTRGFGDIRDSMEESKAAGLSASIGIIEVSHSNGKLISVNIVK